MNRHSVIGVAGLALAVFAGTASAQEVELRLAHSLSSTEPAHLAAERFAEAVTQRSDGQVEVNVFPGEQLGSGKDVNQMIRQGANVMNITDPGYLSDFVPDVGVLNGPYLLTDPLSFPKLLGSDWYQEIDQQLQEKGIRALGWGLFGARHLLADKPVRTPADMAGMTVRVPPNQMWIETFQAMGARPTTVEWSEVYNALQQNVVEAAEAPLGSLYGSKLYETRKTLSTTGHFTAWVALVMSEQVFDGLPQETQKLLLEEGKAWGDTLTQTTLEKQEGYIGQMEAEGVTLVRDVDLGAFQKQTARVYEAFPDWTPGLRDRIQGILSEGGR